MRDYNSEGKPSTTASLQKVSTSDCNINDNRKQHHDCQTGNSYTTETITTNSVVT